MWLPVVCLLATVAIGQSKNAAGIENFRLIAQKNNANFEKHILREFEDTKIPIPPSGQPQETIEDMMTLGIGDENLAILKDLKLARHPDIKISSLSSTMEYFSIRVSIDVGDVVLSGKIYVNEDPAEPVRDVRYTMRNVKGFGVVGLGLPPDGGFVSTNYFMNYNHDYTELESTWKEGNLGELEPSNPEFSENQLKAEIHRVINPLLKRRLDAALTRISPNDAFGIWPSNLVEIKEEYDTFYNDIVDVLLVDLNNRIEENDMVQVALPDLDVPFIYKILGFDVNGQVLGSEGWVRSLATFVRRGPVSLSTESGNFIILVTLGMTELTLGYDVCTVKVAGIGPSGDIFGTINKNAAELAVAINLQNQTISLDRFEITELSDFDVKVTGFGLFNWLASKIVTRVIDQTKTYFVPTIESIVKDQIDQALASFNASQIIKSIENFFD